MRASSGVILFLGSSWRHFSSRSLNWSSLWFLRIMKGKVCYSSALRVLSLILSKEARSRVGLSPRSMVLVYSYLKMVNALGVLGHRVFFLGEEGEVLVEVFVDECPSFEEL